MKLKDILAIGGKPGLYRFIAQAKSGIIVESLSDKKRIPAHASDKVSALEDIAIFTETDEVPLSKIFDKIYEKENGGKSLDPKKASGEELKSYFEEILPEYDRNRVYTSDMKKVFAWYNQLHEQDLLIQEEEEEEELKPEGSEEEKPSEEKSSEEKEGKE